MLNTKQKLTKLRKLFPKYNIDCYLVPHTDEFQNEFLPKYSRRLEWLSDFTGSAGDIIVTKNKAYIFVDGRYTIQAENEVDKSCFSIINYKDATPSKVLNSFKKNNLRIGFDSNILTIGKLEFLKKQSKNKAKYVEIKKNLVDELWSNKPRKVQSKPFYHQLKYSGEKSEKKIKKLIGFMNKFKIDRYILTSTESICWLFNVRAKDIEYSPLFLSKAIIESNGKSIIFSDFNKSLNLGTKIQSRKLKEIKKYISETKNSHLRYMTSASSISVELYRTVSKSNKIIFKDDIVEHLKSQKNKTEIKGMKNAHIRDGAALAKFIYWIKNSVPKKKTTELDAIAYLDNLRRKNKNFFSLSFPTIAGTGPNGAIVHYRASKKSNRRIKKTDLFLVDSGAQYLDGTTDVTRTIAFKNVTKEQKAMYTRVLKGHIAVAKSKSSSREKGKNLDKLARKYLKQVNKNFDHGTGHGVGSFLNVHEGPQVISPSGSVNFKHGMIVSNEPGYYKKNNYGIRIENLILAKVANNILKFETITLAPLEKQLIDYNLLSREEIKWINNYHSKVRKYLLPFMSDKQSIWLKEETEKIIH